MDRTDLTVIGRLVRRQHDGFYRINFVPAYQHVWEQLQECFLIFSSNRVFFVTVEETKTVANRCFLLFKEDGIDAEYDKSAKVTVALADVDLAAYVEEDELSAISGSRVIFLDKQIGIVDDVLQNSMQSTLVITLEDKRELLVPYVDAYVDSLDTAKKLLVLKDIEELIAICTSMS